MKNLVTYLTLVLSITTGIVSPVFGQEIDSARVRAQVRFEQQMVIERIARQVAQAVLAEGDSLTADQSALVVRVTRQLAQDVALAEAIQQRVDDEREESKKLIQSVVLNVAKGIAIVIALLVLRAIIQSIGKGVRNEGADAPLGVLITTRTEEKARELGKTLVAENLASGGTVTPSIRSIYRMEADVSEAPEAMVFLKTTNGQLGNLIERAEELDSASTPEILAISRSMMSDY